MRSRTYIATPPGATIKEQLTDRGMSQKEFAARMGMTEKHISKLINGDVQLTTDMAMRLEMVLSIPAHFWNNLESLYREKLALVENENAMDADLEIVKKIPYSEMAKNKWVPEAHTQTEKVINIRKFFEVFKLDLLSETAISGINCRKLGESEKSDYALLAWAQKAKLEARNIPVGSINIAKLKASLPIIRSMTRQDPSVFCTKLCDLLADCGIALVFLPHIGGSFLHGATFYDGPKIVIGMTVRGKVADRFWFSLFHEFGHVILGHLGNNEIEADVAEREADAFASETLIPKADFDTFVQANVFNKRTIRQFADEEGIDAGIVVGRLQKEAQIPFSAYNDLKPRYVISA